MATLRLATFNALSGRSPGAGLREVPDLGALIRSVRGLDADVVALQEVDAFQARSGTVDQVAELVAALSSGPSSGDATWTGRLVPTLRGTPSLTRTWEVAAPDDPAPTASHPAYGVALLTRRPVRAWREHRMTGHWGRLPMLLPTPNGRVAPLLVPDEPRAAVGAVIETDAGPAFVAGTHLSFLPPRAMWQLRAVTRWAATVSGDVPSLFMGDLNLPAAVASRVSGWAPLARHATFPRDAPRLQLDHVLSGRLGAWRVTGSRTVEGEVSDHRALVVDLAT